MTTQTHKYRCFVDSPLGRLQLVASSRGLVSLYYPEHRHARNIDAEEVKRHAVLDSARRELEQYFRGQRTHFDTPLAPPEERGGTPFQLAVWNALVAIPFGETRSYGELARSIGRPSAVRAVGAANALNPISIFVPCHRVIGAAGALTGYAGGIEAKRWLLEHEALDCSSSARSAQRKATLRTTKLSAPS